MGKVSSGLGSGTTRHMKVLYLINGLGTGKGGHFHSLNHISREIAKLNQVKIIVLGPVRSEIIEENPFFYRRIRFNGLNMWSVKNELDSFFNFFKPDIIHCFDVSVYNIAKLLVNGNKYKFVLNKCGGSNPPYFPYVENLILFSKENMKWFDNQNKKYAKNIYLIPNRVRAVNIKSVKDVEKNESLFNFVRIARIGNSYKKSIRDSIKLVKELSRFRSKIKLYIIGSVEEESVLVELKEYAENANVVFLTDDKYTKEASQMLYLADAVIGTGRGLMEAASLALPVLTPASNSNYPILINKDNFDSFFETNFSPRNIVTDEVNNKNLSSIIKLIDNIDYRNKQSKYSLNLFLEKFDVKQVSTKYQNVYNIAIMNSYNVPFWKNIIMKLKILRVYFINS
ncbi:glycosyltransferase family 4 protein [Mesonia maritima]|uniref:Glycosyltransferase involved in cell wall biosynthesis n=1 Tax=Mesonia maritima TaxID=1793873 RepID=A0ABU1K865_9FLAO|nr:glycosyltransferase family 4 protein [Mesonia maritima]MDR6301793.1 glycosyltransferase involved in cell wall biosynthesis [Mesonia maritima]